MKNVKRLACAIAVLTALLIQPHAALARFAGTLHSDIPWTVEITPEVINSDSIAVTVTFLDSRGREDVDFFTLPKTDPRLVAYSGANIPRGTRRIIIEVEPPLNGFAQLRIFQGTTLIALDVNGDERFVFDVV